MSTPDYKLRLHDESSMGRYNHYHPKAKTDRRHEMTHRFIAIAILLATLAILPRLAANETEPAEETVLPPPKQADALALEDLEGMALEQNPTLVQAAMHIRISRGEAIQAGLYPNPTVGYVGDQIGINGTAGEMQGAFIEQEIVTAGKLQLSRAKYLQGVEQAEANFEAQQYRVLSSVRKAFYRTFATQRQVSVRRELLVMAEDALKTTRGLLNVGQANRPDVLMAEVQVSRIRAELRAAQRKYEGHWQELVAYVGIPEMQVTELDGKLEIKEAEILDRDAVLSNLLNCSPQLRAAWAEVIRDRIVVQRERVEPIPNLNIRAQTGYNFETENAVAGVSLGIKLPLYNRNQGSVMQARAELARAEAEIARIDLSLRRKFGEVFGNYEAALALAQALQDEALPKSREAYEAYSEAFKNRRAAWPQVLVAQREFIQLSDEYLETLIQLREAEADINGLFLGDGLDEPNQPTPTGHRDATPNPR